MHADVLMIEPGDTGSIKVDQARAAIERSAYRPFEGRRRVVIVNEADAMEASAQNALLKTLEEPPAASTFVLVTSRPGSAAADGAVALPAGPVRAAEPGRHRAGVDRATTASPRRTRMRPRPWPTAASARALEGDTEAYVEAREAAVSMLGTVAQASNPMQRLAAARALGRDKVDRDELGRRLRLVSSVLRDLGVLQARAEERALAHGDLKPALQRLLPAFEGDRAVRAFSAVEKALAALDRNASPKIVADWLAFQV